MKWSYFKTNMRPFYCSLCFSVFRPTTHIYLCSPIKYGIALKNNSTNYQKGKILKHLEIYFKILVE